MNLNNQPSILVRLVHSVPHFNITMNHVNSTFDLGNLNYKEVSILMFYHNENSLFFRIVFEFLLMFNVFDI